jgi:hypothetical protein
MDNITNIKNVNPDTLEFQEYQDEDNSLISSFDVSDVAFKPGVDTLEFHVFDSNKNIILSEYNFKKYSLIDNNIVIDKKENLISYGFEEGQFYTLYNFITSLFNSNEISRFYISEISSDRTELRLSSNTITGLKEAYDTFVSSSNAVSYYKDFYLNFGDNNLVIANNVLLQGNDLLIKLYEPLSSQFDIKSELWVIEKLAESIAYFFELITVLIENDDILAIKGPNLNISIKDRISNSTGYLNYDLLQNSPSSSLTNQLNNILNKKAIRLNIDHSDYANFIHFSSAETRLENFVYKLSLIESYSQSVISSSYSSTNFYLTESRNIYTNKIKDIVEGFDNYEYHLYFNSGSTSWPKSNVLLPYVNYPSTSSAGLSWLSGQLDSASLYDSENKDNLLGTVPSYLRNDPRNAPYELYVEMLGHHFDILYLYTKELNNKYNTDNRVDYGMSKDLISDALKDFGIKIYQNNYSSNDLYSAFLGINSNLGLLPPTGSEWITTYITASSQVIPLEDVNAETYKRIYHNLPLLLKKKGTIDGLRLLISTYGIPDTILRVSEFGGKNKTETNDWDQFQNHLNYAFYTTSSGFIKYNLPGVNSLSGSLSTVEFRFRTTGIPLQNISQSLAHFAPDYNFNLVLEYSGSSLSTGSYSSSIVDPFNEYGTLKFIDSSSNRSASLYLPFFDGDWWSVMVTINNETPFTSSLHAKNKIYSGYDGKQIGFQASSSVSSSYWANISQSLFLSHSGSKVLAGKTYLPFSGSFQELRLYKTALNETSFNDFVMNPHSIEGNSLEGDNSYNSLIFRAPLGSVLENNTSASRISIHPSIYTTESFGTAGSSIYTLSGSYTFIPNKEVFYYDQFPAGIKNIISSKVDNGNEALPLGNTLSPFITIQQNYSISSSYTRDVNYVEVGFSPQNEINEDIISQLGYFNIGNYIGDPRQLVNKNTIQYVDFNKLRDEYFKKYNRPFGLSDFIRLIKYFDNSLFKLIKDFVPARTSLATGIIIKQHLLERNRYSPAQLDYELEDYSGSIKSAPFNFTSSILYKVIGSNAGMMPNITQSFSESFIGPTGLSLISHTDNVEFFNGEFSGATITVTTQSLNHNPFLNDFIPLVNYKLKFYYDASVDEYNFLDNIIPMNGQILFYPTYIKISKYDNNGNFNINLRFLETLIIQFSDKSLNNYIITSRNEYSDHYVYSIINNIGGLTSDGEVLNYKTTASFIGEVTHSVGPTSTELQSIPINSISIDTRGYLTSSFFNFTDIGSMNSVTASFYTFQDYPNIRLTFSMSAKFETTSPLYIPYFALCRTRQPVQNLHGFNTTGLPPEVEILASVTDTLGAVSVVLTIVKDINDSLAEHSYFVVFNSTLPNSSITASNFLYQITQSVAPQVGSIDLIAFNPYLSQKFEGSDFDVLAGNIDATQNSQYYKKIDYVNYGISLAYFNQIMSGSGTPAPVKDYYYSLRRHIYPRYIGSRNSSDNFNTSSIVVASLLQQNLHLNLGPSVQQGVAYKYDTTIFEIEGGDIPFELYSFGRLRIKQIISADSLDAARQIPLDDSDFSFTKENQLSPGDIITINNYTNNSNLPKTAKIKTTLISPEISSYISSPTIPGNYTLTAGTNVLITGHVSNSIASVISNNGMYYTGSIGIAIDMLNNISKSMGEGDDWYMSLFTGSFNVPLSSTTSLTPYPIERLISQSDQANYLQSQGIFKITSCSIAFGNQIQLHTQVPTASGLFQNTVFFGPGSSTPGGFLIWKNKRKGSAVIVEKSNLNGLEAGNFLSSNASPFIKDNLNYLTQTFGNKPKN